MRRNVVHTATPILPECTRPFCDGHHTGASQALAMHNRFERVWPCAELTRLPHSVI